MKFDVIHYTEDEGSTVVHTTNSIYDAEEYTEQYMQDLVNEMDESALASREGENAWNVYDSAGFQHTVYFQ